MEADDTGHGAVLREAPAIFPWWLILLWGILTLVIGSFFITSPVLTLGTVIMFMGAYWLAGGLFTLCSLAIDRSARGVKVLLSAVNIGAGALVLSYPLFSMLFIVTFFIIFIGFLACGIGGAHLRYAFGSGDPGNAVLGIVSLIFGILLLIIPFTAALLLPSVIGGFCIVSGISAIIASFMAKKARQATGL